MWNRHLRMCLICWLLFRPLYQILPLKNNYGYRKHVLLVGCIYRSLSANIVSSTICNVDYPRYLCSQTNTPTYSQGF